MLDAGLPPPPAPMKASPHRAGVQPLLVGFGARARPRIALFRALFIGDLLCAVPAFRALRAALPGAHIVLLGLPWAASFVRRFSGYLDGLLPFPGAPGLADGGESGGTALEGFLYQVRQHQFDLAIQLHGSGETSNALLSEFGAPWMAGFHPAREPAPTPYFLPWVPQEHEVSRWLRLLRVLGAPECGSQLEWPIEPDEAEAASRILHGCGLDGGKGLVCIHAGARLPSRRWPAERFAAVAAHLSAQGFGILLSGSTEEASLVAQVEESIPPGHRRSVANLAGVTTLGELAALISRSQLVICNDTGVSHLASALGIASVVISSGGDAGRWAPIGAVRHEVLSHPLDCRPCHHSVCPIGHPCAMGVTVVSVIEAVQRRLDLPRQPLVAAAGPSRSTGQPMR